MERASTKTLPTDSSLDRGRNRGIRSRWSRAFDRTK